MVGEKGVGEKGRVVVEGEVVREKVIKASEGPCGSISQGPSPDAFLTLYLV